MHHSFYSHCTPLPPSESRNNNIALHFWHLLKLDIPSSLDHASSFQRKTFLFPSLSWEPFSPQPSRAGQFPRRENTESVSDGFHALVCFSYLNTFLWSAAKWEGWKARILPICNQKSSDRAELRLTPCSMPSRSPICQNCVCWAFLPFIPFPLGLSYKRCSYTAMDFLPLLWLQKAAQLPAWPAWADTWKPARSKPHWNPELPWHGGKGTTRGSVGRSGA